MRKHLHPARLLSYVAHRRITAFWLVALLSLTVPWALKGCQMPPVITAEKVYGECAVKSIYDGDTMTVFCAGEKLKIRLYCIDAPEMGQEPWGRLSRDHLRAITPPVVRIIEHDKDRYGRIVAEVIVPDESEENLNRSQVFAGHAAMYRRYCSNSSYIEAEKVARSMSVGIWLSSGQHQTPWEWRLK